MITSGAIIAGLEHLDTDNVEGYTLVILANILSSISLILAKRYNESDSLKPLGLLPYSILSRIDIQQLH